MSFKGFQNIVLTGVLGVWGSVSFSFVDSGEGCCKKGFFESIFSISSVIWGEDADDGASLIMVSCDPTKSLGSQLHKEGATAFKL